MMNSDSSGDREELSPSLSPSSSPEQLQQQHQQQQGQNVTDGDHVVKSSRTTEEEEEERAVADRRRKQRQENLIHGEDMKKSTRHLSADVRKNSAFVKRLRGYGDLPPEQKAVVQRELDQLSLKLFISEIVSAITQDLQQPEQRNSLKMDPSKGGDDLERLAQLCSTLHQYYDDFSEQLYTALIRSTKYEPPKSSGAAGVSATSSGAGNSSSSSTQSHAGTGVTGSGSGLASSSGGERFFDHGKVQFALILACELYVIGVFDDVNNIYILLKQFIGKEADKRALPTLNVVLQFMRHYGDVFLQLEKNRVESEEIRQSRAFMSASESIVSEAERNQFRRMMAKFFKALCERLYQMHLQLTKMEDEKHSELMGNTVEGKTTTAKEDKQAYEKLRKAWIKLYEPVKLLGDYLDQDVPENVTEGLARLEQMQQEKELESLKQNVITEHLFENEETRIFYEDLPDIVKLTEEKKAKETVKDDSSAASRSRNANKIDSLFSKLPKCCSRILINNWAIDFVLLAGKSAKKKLVRTLFSVNRTSLELLPHYSRLVAILQPIHKDLGELLVEMLKEEFETLFSEKDQIKIESKIKNIKFLGELVKFRICPSGYILDCLERCLDNFTHHNIDVACALLETCGRFLYVSPESHERTSEHLEKMMRLREVKALDSKHDTMIQNAYYVSKRQTDANDEVTSNEWTRLPILQQYVNNLLFEQLHKQSVEKIVTQLRKLPWNTDPDIQSYVLNSIRNSSRYLAKYSNVHLLADIISSISHHHNIIGYCVVDRLLEDIRCALSGEFEVPPQRRIFDVKLLGELYTYRLLEAKLVFETLYMILFYCQRKDAPENAFRVCLVCTILDTIGEFLDTRSANRRLDRFLLYLQRYILEKQRRLPIDIEFMLADTLESVRPKLKWPRSLKEARQRIAILEAKRNISLPCFATGHTINSDYSEASDQIQPMSMLVNADERVWPVETRSNVRRAVNDDHDDDDDEDDDDEQDDVSSFVDEIDLERQRYMRELQKQRGAEESELDRELQSMVQESISERVVKQPQGSRKVDITNLLFNSTQQVSGIRAFQQRIQLMRTGDSSTGPDGGKHKDSTASAPQVNHTFKFTMLTQKEKKEVDIPDNSGLVIHTRRNIERQEELEARAREYEERRTQEMAREFNQSYGRRMMKRGDYYK